jgi:hypothetical protein
MSEVDKITIDKEFVDIIADVHCSQEANTLLYDVPELDG